MIKMYKGSTMVEILETIGRGIVSVVVVVMILGAAYVLYKLFTIPQIFPRQYNVAAYDSAGNLVCSLTGCYKDSKFKNSYKSYDGNNYFYVILVNRIDTSSYK